jgi:hypothetical protein
MCRRTTCTRCGKTTWAGCGRHVDQVLAGVSPADRCPGHAPDSAPARGSVPSGPHRSLMARLFGR